MAGLDMYVLLTWACGLQYASLFPLFQIAPSFFQLLLFESDEHFTSEATSSIEALFLILMTTVAPIFLYAAHTKATTLIDVTVLQRLCLVFPMVFVTMAIGQNPFEDYHFMYLMLIVDVALAVLHGLFAPGGYKGLLTRFWEHWSNSPLTSIRRALRVEAYVGMAFGLMVIAHSSITSDVPLAALTVGVGTCVQYFWFWYAAHVQDEEGSDGPSTTYWAVIVTRLVFGAGLLCTSEALRFATTPFRLQAIAVLLGASNPFAGVATNSISTLYLYGKSYQFIEHDEHGPLLWLVGWAVVTVISSYGWLFLFLHEYDDDQTARVKRTHFQDWLLALFMPAVGGVLDSAGRLGPGSIGAPVAYLLPPVTLWFTLETKMLTHLKAGTPFHPTWWVDGTVDRFAASDYINLTFSIATALITAILTTYAFVAVGIAVGFSSLSFASNSLWKFSAAHGMLFIFHSGMWMILASSGVPPLSPRRMFAVLEIPPILKANPHDCVPQHKIDLMVGIVLLYLGGFALGDSAPKAWEVTFKVVVGLAWLAALASKVRIHHKSWGYVEPIDAALPTSDETTPLPTATAPYTTMT